MNAFFQQAARQAKKAGDSHERIQLMQQLSDREDWSVKDFSQFGQLMPVAEFRSEYDLAIYEIHDDCTDIMLYPQMYYINLLKDGTWSYKGLLTPTVIFCDHRLDVVEAYMYNDILEVEKFLQNLRKS